MRTCLLFATAQPPPYPNSTPLINIATLQAQHFWRETVIEEIVLQKKLPILVHELIFIELWRKTFLPEISAEFHSQIRVEEMHGHPSVRHAIIPLLRYEVTCLEILQAAIIHPESVESLREASLDLTDYILRYLKEILEQCRTLSTTALVSYPYLMKISKSIPLIMMVPCLLILSNLVNHDLNKCGPFNDDFVTRLILSTDSPMLIVDLMMCSPWETNNRITWCFNFDIQVWCTLSQELEADIFFLSVDLLRRLFCYEKFRSNYLRTDGRNEKLRKALEFLETKEWKDEVIYKVFKNALDQGTFSALLLDDNPKNLPLPLEVSHLPFMKEQFEKTFDEDHKKILKQNLNELLLHFSSSTFEEKEKIWNCDIDDHKLLDPSLLPQVHHCSNCSAEATNVCSHCRKHWYCSKKCQKSHWKAHKKSCMTKTTVPKTFRQSLVLS
jgi:hypothetical protein